jgi:adenylyltransferase/sulfurtransferase
MNLERYSRQILLKDFGAKAQQKLSEARVLVVGAGGLGTPVLTYLNAMGVGTLGLVDRDVVALSNLHRQVLFDEADIGKSKVAVALSKLKAQNGNTKLIGHALFLDRDNALDIIESYDLVVDASDNFPTRYLINDACVILKKPFVYGALHGFEGQLSVFNHKGGPTYRCLFPEMPKADEVPNCDQHGVLGILPGIVGNLQALEAIKVISGVGEVLSGTLLLFDGLANRFQKINFKSIPMHFAIDALQESYEMDCGMPFPSVDTEAFERLLASGPLQLIDVRDPDEFTTFNIRDSINIPLSELVRRKGEIDIEKPIYFLCQSGIRSQKAILELKPYHPNAQLVNVTGGINKLQQYVAKY